MRQTLHFRSFGYATSAFFAITYVLCVGFDLVFPASAMHRAWQLLLPGFHWLTWPSLIVGFIESYAYGWYVALIWIPVYNIAVARRGRT
jgi:P-type Cu+ transporter